MKENNLKEYLLEDFKKHSNLELYSDEESSKKKENLFYAKISLILCNFFYVISSVSIKLINQYKSNYDYNSFSFIRFLVMFILSYKFKKTKSFKFNSLFQIKNKFWFFIRLLTNYSSLLFLVFALYYIRLSTATVLFMIYPVFTNILSVFFLREKFRIKYLIGCIICFLGSILFLLSERNNELLINQEKDSLNNETYKESLEKLSYDIDLKVFLGGFFCMLIAISVSFLTISAKFLSKEMDSILINLYTGIYLAIMSFLMGIILNFENFFADLSDFYYLIQCIANGIVIFLAFYYMNESAENAELSKVSYLNYLEIVMGILFGILFFGEYFGILDMIGFVIIMGTNFYLSLDKKDD